MGKESKYHFFILLQTMYGFCYDSSDFCKLHGEIGVKQKTSFSLNIMGPRVSVCIHKFTKY